MDLKKYKRNNKVGIRDAALRRIILPAIYDEIKIYSNWIIAWNNPKYDEELCLKSPCDGDSFVFDKKGHRFYLSYHGERIDYTILSISPFDKYLFKAKARVNGEIREGLFNELGEVVIPFDYEIIRPLDYEFDTWQEGYQMTQLLYKVGIDVEYELEWYDDDYEQKRKWYRKIKHAKWGIIDQEGRIVFPLEYDLIGSLGGNQHPSILSDPSADFYGRYVVVGKAGKKGLCRRDGNDVLPIHFTCIDLGENDLVRYYVGGERITDDNRDYCTGGLWGVGLIQSGLYTSPQFEAVVFTDKNPGAIANAVHNGVAGTISEYLRFTENRNQSEREVKDIMKNSNVYWELEIETHDYGWTQAELDDMYRAAYENDPSASWNNY